MPKKFITKRYTPFEVPAGLSRSPRMTWFNRYWNESTSYMPPLLN